MFRRRGAGATDGTAQDSPGAQSPDDPADVKQARPAAEAGKGRPTPKRSEAERGRYQPITGSRAGSGASRAPARPQTPEEKQRARSDRVTRMDAMKRGEQWALNPKDRGPVRALARDYVDSKRRISEYYMYILLVMVVYLFVGTRTKAAQEYATPAILALVAVIAIEARLMKRGLDKLVAARLPGESTKGLTWYAMQRALQIRRLRIPAPKVQPGDKI